MVGVGICSERRACLVVNILGGPWAGRGGSFASGGGKSRDLFYEIFYQRSNHFSRSSEFLSVKNFEVPKSLVKIC